MKQRDKAVYHLYIDGKIKDMFQRLYPSCQTRFLENCLRLACNDKTFFDKMFFGVEPNEK